MMAYSHMKTFWISWIDWGYTSINDTNCPFYCSIDKITGHFIQRSATQYPTRARNNCYWQLIKQSIQRLIL
jgi:hypothetical protein